MADIAMTGTGEIEITIKETEMAIEAIEVSIVDEVAIEADLTTVAATEEVSVAAEEEAVDTEAGIEEDGMEELDIVVAVVLAVMLPPAGLQEISLSTHQPVPPAAAVLEVDTKTGTAAALIMSLSVVLVLEGERRLDLSLHLQGKNTLTNEEANTAIDDDTMTGVEVVNEIIIEVMVENEVIEMEMTDGVVIVVNTRMAGVGVTKMIAVLNDGGTENDVQQLVSLRGQVSRSGK